MNKVRKDKKGYHLRVGESQKKDGRYTYAYTDGEGKRHYIYAQTLVELRAKEKDIRKQLDEGLDPHTARMMTLNQLFDRYIEQKFDLKDTTKANYIYIYNHFVRESFGKRKIAEITYTDVKKFYYKLLEEKKMKPNTLENINNLVHPSFELAIRDGILMRNPSAGVMKDIKKSKIWVKTKRRALTRPQQKAFMTYIASDKQFKGWEPIITVLLGTGMRIGECLALKWDDCDFDNREIHVRHTLSYRPSGKGYCELHVTPPKTDAGIRTIPMLSEVYDALLEEYQIQSCLGFCTQEIDRYYGFVFSTAFGTVYSEGAVNNAIHRIVDAYNTKEEKDAKEEKREPFYCLKLVHII